MLLALGKASGDVSDQAMGVIAFAFAFLAIGSTYAISRNDAILRRASPWLTRLGLHDLKATKDDGEAPAKHGRIFLLGFFVDGELAARGDPAAQAPPAATTCG